MTEPVVLFFVLGLLASLARSDLRLPPALYDTLSIYLLLAIGLRGGVELARPDPGAARIAPLAAALALSIVVPVVAYTALRRLGRFNVFDAASIAAHYGSVSVVTFAVASTYLTRQNIPFEGTLTFYMVLMEMPAILVGILLARRGAGAVDWRVLAREVFLGKSVLLLLGGLAIGYLAGPTGIVPLDRFFFDLFKGLLALFLLEMGVVAGSRVRDLRRGGWFLAGFGVVMPLLAAALGTLLGYASGLSMGGTMLLATLAASASYIAVPAAMRIAVPEANPTLSLTASLGVTFPFNIVLGIPLYQHFAAWVFA